MHIITYSFAFVYSLTSAFIGMALPYALWTGHFAIQSTFSGVLCMGWVGLWLGYSLEV